MAAQSRRHADVWNNYCDGDTLSIQMNAPVQSDSHTLDGAYYFHTLSEWTAENVSGDDVAGVH